MLSFKKPITYQPAHSYFKISSPHIYSKHNTGNNMTNLVVLMKDNFEDKLLMPTHNNNKIIDLRIIINTTHI